ncbi:hypothetical protein [Kosakonia radicincitans]
MSRLFFASFLPATTLNKVSHVKEAMMNTRNSSYPSDPVPTDPIPIPDPIPHPQPMPDPPPDEEPIKMSRKQGRSERIRAC